MSGEREKRRKNEKKRGDYVQPRERVCELERENKRRGGCVCAPERERVEREIRWAMGEKGR